MDEIPSPTYPIASGPSNFGNFNPRAETVHDRASIASYLRTILTHQNNTNLSLTPLTEKRIHELLIYCTQPNFTTTNIPNILDEVTTLLTESAKFADAIRKLQAMQLEWFDLRFSSYTNFRGLSDASIKARETLRRFTRRHDAIQVTKLWRHNPPPPQTPNLEPQPADLALDLFERSSWDLIHQTLEREDNLVRKFEELHRSHAARMEIRPQTSPIFKPGPMTALVQRLAAHTLDSTDKNPTDITNMRAIIADYIVRRQDSHLENDKSIKQLAAAGLFYELAGRLAFDLNAAESLPRAVDESQGPYIRGKIVDEIRCYFEGFWMDGETKMVQNYIVHPEIYQNFGGWL